MNGAGEKKSAQKGRTVWRVIFLILLAGILLFGGFRVYMLAVTSGEYMITTDNYFDYQRHYECSGYAPAYALRSLGVQVTGLELYYSYGNKNPDGTLDVNPLVENLRELGYQSSFHVGTLTDLKYAVKKGTPVVVVIQVDLDRPYLHYVPVVGYDKDYIYVAESLDYMVTGETEHYNRKIEIETFKKLWNNKINSAGNIYITVGVK